MPSSLSVTGNGSECEFIQWSIPLTLDQRTATIMAHGAPWLSVFIRDAMEIFWMKIRWKNYSEELKSMKAWGFFPLWSQDNKPHFLETFPSWRWNARTVLGATVILYMWSFSSPDGFDGPWCLHGYGMMLERGHQNVSQLTRPMGMKISTSVK